MRWSGRSVVRRSGWNVRVLRMVWVLWMVLIRLVVVAGVSHGYLSFAHAFGTDTPILLGGVVGVKRTREMPHDRTTVGNRAKHLDCGRPFSIR